MEVCAREGRGDVFMEILQRDLSREVEKLQDLESKAETLSVVETTPEIRSFSSTTNPDGTVTIWNKSEEEVQRIRQQFYDNPNVHRTRSRQEIENERIQKQQEDRLAKLAAEEREEELRKKDEDREEEEKRKREFIDYSKQWKTFMLADKQAADKV